jgi:hypothetical protein
VYVYGTPPLLPDPEYDPISVTGDPIVPETGISIKPVVLGPVAPSVTVTLLLTKPAKLPSELTAKLAHERSSTVTDDDGKTPS